MPDVTAPAALSAGATAALGTWFMPLLVSILWKYRYDVKNPEGRVIDRTVPDEVYDFVIVGGGSAGSVLASRLTENPKWKILVLEAGGDETEISDMPVICQYMQLGPLDWQYKSEPQPQACRAMKNGRCNFPAGRALGGSSVINYMLYVRGNRNDYDNWARNGNYGWSYEEVLPYFKKSEDNQSPFVAQNKKYHATGGYLTISDGRYHTPLGAAFLAGGVEMGYEVVDFNAERQTGVMFPQLTQRRGARCSVAKAFLRPVRFRPNLHISLRSYVHKILIGPNRRAWGVKYEKNGKVRIVRARNEVILSAGGIASPVILMRSGIGPKEHLLDVGIHPIQDLNVGRNLQDHICIGASTFVVKKPLGLVEPRIMNVKVILKWLLYGQGPLTSPGGVDAMAFMNTKYANASEDWPDIEFHFTAGSAATDGGRQVKRVHGLSDRTWHEFFKPIAFKDTFTAFPTLLRPKSRGVIKLRSKNPYDHPLIYPNYLTHPEDIARLVEGMKLAVVMAETKAFKQVGAHFYKRVFPGCEHTQFFTDEYWECLVRHYTETLYHYTGTVKMGPFWDPEAVVDPECRVYGITDLRVIDTSIFPQVTSGNTNAPVIMVAEKMADLIKLNYGYTTHPVEQVHEYHEYELS